MDAFLMIFGVSPENAKVRFDCAGASGLRFRPLIFWLRASIFAVRFLHRLFVFFGLSWGPRSTGTNLVGGRGGTPLNEIN